MPELPLLSDYALVALLVLSVGWDLKARRIPNWLTLAALVVALLLRIPLGFGVVLSGAGAATLAFLIVLPVFALGGLGGGDVKLLAAVGAFLGLDRVWVGLLATFVAGGLMAVLGILARRKSGESVMNLYVILRGLIRKASYTQWRSSSHDEPDASVTIRSPGVVVQPYAVAIATGAIVALLHSHFGGAL